MNRIKGKKALVRLKNRFRPMRLLHYFLKWAVISVIVGFISGSASALFLYYLDKITELRSGNLWIIGFLPIGGLIIGFLYYYLGKGTEKGNNLILETIEKPGKVIPWKMAPLVLVTTWLTHMVGGSAGREGTAIQMSGALTDQWSKWLGLSRSDRKSLLIASISAGFASVFGTPLAGMVFGLEILFKGKVRYEAIFPAAMSAIIANYITMEFWHIGHATYLIGLVPSLDLLNFLTSIGVGIAFGLTAFLFIKSHDVIQAAFSNAVAYPPLRPFFGGAILAIAFFILYEIFEKSDYQGLGIPVIVASFTTPAPYYAFALKLLLTAFTLGCGFKGGEVTPLFFIGAVLGSALAMFLPLPVGLLAGMGFVAVFAGATNTPLACIFMGIELFGAEAGVYITIACVTAYLVSGKTSIYTSQRFPELETIR